MNNLIWLNAIFILLLTLFLGKFGLRFLHKLQLGQTVRSDGPATHFVKSGTPTFGGLFFLIPLAISAVVLPLINQDWISYGAIIVLMLLFGLVGFLDDYTKVKVTKDGLSVSQKTIGLAIICIVFAVWLLWFSDFEPFIYIPFISRQVLIVGNWKYLYLIFIVLYLFFMSNAVNITDGLDGLASSLMTVSALSLGVSIYVVYRSNATTKPMIGACIAIAAGSVGFLAYNFYPAKVFMGDTGSQALGVGFAAIALVVGMPWLMLITGLVYILEALSTMLQVFYFKATGGKRLFKMAPLHHHFELIGWHEKKVVTNFVIFGIVCGMLGVLVVI
ncbi:MAG TPA: phospho-N-acetylmuramoyl-pentapeptide-transferase [Clostridiaceae bacterium]|nr:phospho-N-acetylmuramoyl-pentapeptide-transferase [Clostridiaceae bacterium]